MFEFIKNSDCFTAFVCSFLQLKVSSIMIPRTFYLSRGISKALLIILYSMYFDLLTLRDNVFIFTLAT